MQEINLNLTVPQLRALSILYSEEFQNMLADRSRVYLTGGLVVSAVEVNDILRSTLAAIDIEYVRQLGGN